jgi:hypothetical protein
LLSGAKAPNGDEFVRRALGRRTINRVGAWGVRKNGGSP